MPKEEDGQAKIGLYSKAFLWNLDPAEGYMNLSPSRLSNRI